MIALWMVARENNAIDHLIIAVATGILCAAVVLVVAGGIFGVITIIRRLL